MITKSIINIIVIIIAITIIVIVLFLHWANALSRAQLPVHHILYAMLTCYGLIRM